MASEGRQHALPIGSRIDRYEVIEQLGVGGFGITYKARDPKLHVDVAIKEFLPLELAGRDGATTTVVAHASRAEEYRYGLDRFLDEGRTLARFKHNNVVRVTNYLEANGTAYLVMDYERGQSLSDYLKANPGVVSEQQLKAWFVPVLRGLVEVHKAGFLHRDIKPGNIYLRDEGEPLLIDFGAARQAIGEHSRSVTGIVSAGYAPTEQYGTDAKKQGPWTDLYSIGATLYRCVAGRDPVDAPTRQSTISEEEPDPLIPAEDVGEGRYSVELLQLVDWLLCLPMRKRPRSAQDVLTALEQGVGARGSDSEPRSTVLTRKIDNPRPSSLREQGASSAPDDITKSNSNSGNMGLLAVAALVIFALVGYIIYEQARSPSLPPQIASVLPAPPAQKEQIKPTVVEDEPAATIAEVVGTHPAVQEAQVVDEPEPKGRLILKLSPENARVVIPDIGPRYSPGMELPVGDYRVIVSADKFASWEGLVTVTEGGKPFSVALQSTHGTLTLDLAPAESQVTLPDLNVKYAPGVSLPRGPHRVWVSASGYHTWKGEISVNANDTYRAISLTRLKLSEQVGKVFRDELESGGEGPEMVVLPAGTFRMGDLNGGDNTHELPVHEVSIKRPISMMKFEVRYQDFRRFAKYSNFRGHTIPPEGVMDDEPVFGQSWNDAQAFARWLTKETGNKYRLPTEAEWEYAARAGSTTKYSWGNSVESNKANCDGCGSKSDKKNTPVGSFSANLWGLHDMHGNMWEWVEDCKHVGYGGAPSDGAAWVSEGDCSERVFRGGSWASSPELMRSSFRTWISPSTATGDMGFRLVREMEP